MREYLLVFLVAVSVSYLLTVIARELALRWGAVAQVRSRDVHTEPTPYLGGVAMYGGMVAAYFVARQLPFLSDNYNFMFGDVGRVLIAGGVICAVGVIDDVLDIDAWTKLGGQVFAAGVLVFLGIQFYSIPTPSGGQISLDPAQGALLTIVLVVAMANAVNFVDGLDGLAAGIIGIGALALFFFCYQLTVTNDVPRATTGALIGVVLAGACAGFLVHNFHPARLFMGDSGSMLLGLVLTSGTILLTGQFFAPDLGDGGGLSLRSLILMLALPLTLIIIPCADLLTAIVRRGFAGESPFKPDKKHLHHKMIALGHSQVRAVLLMWLWAGTIAFGAVLAALYTGPKMWSALAVGLGIAGALTWLVPHLPTLGPVPRTSEGTAGPVPAVTPPVTPSQTPPPTAGPRVR